MILLKNIKINNDIVECDMFPENSKESGHMKLNLKNGEIENYSLPTGFEYCKNHVYKAGNYLIKHIKEIISTPIHEKMLMWY